MWEEGCPGEETARGPQGVLVYKGEGWQYLGESTGVHPSRTLGNRCSVMPSPLSRHFGGPA